MPVQCFEGEALFLQGFVLKLCSRRVLLGLAYKLQCFNVWLVVMTFFFAVTGMLFVCWLCLNGKALCFGFAYGFACFYAVLPTLKALLLY